MPHGALIEHARQMDDRSLEPLLEAVGAAPKHVVLSKPDNCLYIGSLAD